MSPLHFWKLDGAGNDFIGVDGRAVSGEEIRRHAPRWCDRHHGIGADGIVRVTPSSPAPTFEYVNADGTDAFCGNGLRCAVVLARFALGCAPFDAVRTPDGELGVFEVKTSATGWEIEVGVPGADEPIRSLRLTPEWGGEAFAVRVGVPHLVLPVADIRTPDVSGLGPALRRDPRVGPDGANVNWVEERAGTLHMRTYERGVEAETLACGSGAVAVAVWAGHVSKRPVASAIRSAGGDVLRVRERNSDSGALLTLAGPASLVFEGRLS